MTDLFDGGNADVPGAPSMAKGNARGSGYEREAHNWYVESASAVDAILDAERLSGVIYDPACGGGNIPARCEARGLNCIGSDIVDRSAGYPVLDFLTGEIPECAAEVEAILTNPPFPEAEQFVDRAFAIFPNCRRVILFHRLAWLEGRKRGVWFPSVGLARVWVHSSRQSLRPGGKAIKESGGSVAFAWFTFIRGHSGPWAGGHLP